eukprot:10570983-Lingulodinium_polyedra.AAC.1
MSVRVILRSSTIAPPTRGASIPPADADEAGAAGTDPAEVAAAGMLDSYACFRMSQAQPSSKGNSLSSVGARGWLRFFSHMARASTHERGRDGSHGT